MYQNKDAIEDYSPEGQDFVANLIFVANTLPHLKSPNYEKFFSSFVDLVSTPIPIDDVSAADISTIGIENAGRTRRMRNKTNINSQYNLCGVPGVCNPSAIPTCFNVSVGDCDECSSIASRFFIFIILILGLAILMGNLLILLVTAQLYKKRTAKSNDWFKASLAVSDVITGKIMMDTEAAIFE